MRNIPSKLHKHPTERKPSKYNQQKTKTLPTEKYFMVWHIAPRNLQIPILKMKCYEMLVTAVFPALAYEGRRTVFQVLAHEGRQTVFLALA